MVAIKSFGMPSCCINCDMCTSDNPTPKGKDTGHCCITRNFITDIYDKRPSDCPLVEIEEHKVGKWIKTILTEVSGGDFKRGFKCSHCNYVIVTNDFNFCPNCGAEMRGNENEENI